jgi:hypothetical protein
MGVNVGKTCLCGSLFTYLNIIDNRKKKNGEDDLFDNND